MPVGEIRALDLSDVYDEREGRLRDRIYLPAARTKWGHAREIYLNRAVLRLLQNYLDVLVRARRVDLDHGKLLFIA